MESELLKNVRNRAHNIQKMFWRERTHEGGGSGGNGTRLSAPAVPDPNGHRQRFRPSRVRRGHKLGVGGVHGWGAGEVGGGSAAERRRERDGAGRKTGEEGEGVSPVKTKGEERRECLLGGNKRTVRKANKGLGGGHRHRNVFINT